MLPELRSVFSDAPCSCMIRFGDAMRVFGSDAAAPTADGHKLVKLIKEFILKSERDRCETTLDTTSSNVESVLVHVAALGCSVLQARVDLIGAAAVEVEQTVAVGLSTRAPIPKDDYFISRQDELDRVGSVVEAVFTSVAAAPRNVLLLRGYPGLGKSAAAKQGLRLMQIKYDAASCCEGVHVSGIIRGRGAAAAEEDLVRWGRDLGAAIGVGSAAPPDAVLSRLKLFLEGTRYVVLLDDADEAGLQEVLRHLPPSQLPCAVVVTSQMLRRDDAERLVTAAECSAAVRGSSVSLCELQPFTLDECSELLRRVFSVESSAPLHSFDAEVRAVFEELARLPLAVRVFCVWLRNRYRDGMKAVRERDIAAFDEAAAGLSVVRDVLAEWKSESGSVVLAPGAEHSRGLQGTVRLALHSLRSHAVEAECRQLLALLALCPPVRTPWSLFDGGKDGQAALMVYGRRVVVEAQSLGHVCVAGESCRIPKLKLEAVAASAQVKEGGKVSVRLKDGKTVNVRGSDVLFEGDAAAVEMEGQWMLPRVLGNRMEGRVMRQHADGSVSVLFQGPHEGCHVQLRGLLSRADLNGCFGYVCGGCDGATQEWRVRATLPCGEVEEVSVKACHLACTGQVMVGDGDGRLRAVAAFARGWLTARRAGAQVMRFGRRSCRPCGPRVCWRVLRMRSGLLLLLWAAAGLWRWTRRSGCSACTSCCRRLCGRRWGTRRMTSWLRCLKRAAAAWAMMIKLIIACTV